MEDKHQKMVVYMCVHVCIVRERERERERERREREREREKRERERDCYTIIIKKVIILTFFLFGISTSSTPHNDSGLM